jgi:hypothetical protein
MGYFFSILIFVIILLVTVIYKKNSISNKKLSDEDILNSMENGFVEGVVEESAEILKKREEAAIEDIFSKDNKNDVNNPTSSRVNKKFYEGDVNWKFTDVGNNLDCWENWDYLKKGEAGEDIVIKKDVLKALRREDKRTWCPVSRATSSLEKKEFSKPDTITDIIKEKTGEIWGLAGAIGLGLTEELILKSIEKSTMKRMQIMAKKVSEESSEKIMKKLSKEFYEETGEKLFKESGEKVNRELMEKVSKESLEKISKEAEENALKQLSSSMKSKFNKEFIQEAKQKIGRELKQNLLNKYSKKTLNSVKDDIVKKVGQMLAGKTTSINAKLTGNAIKAKLYATVKDASLKSMATAFSGSVQNKILSKVSMQMRKAISITIYKNLMNGLASSITSYASRKIAKVVLMKALLKAQVVIVAKAFFRSQTKLFLKMGASLTSGVDDIAKMTAKLVLLTKTATKESIKAGVKGGLKTAAKLASKLKPGPLAIFDILNFAIDMIDPMGYNNFMPTDQYMEAVDKSNKDRKDIIITEMKKLPTYADVDAANIPYPSVLSPSDKIAIADFEKSISTKMNTLFSLSSIGDTHSCIKPFIDKMNIDLENKILTADELAKEDPDENSTHNKKMKTYYDLLDLDSIISVIDIDNCRKVGGLVYDGDKCTYKKSECDKLYNWPLDDKDDPNRKDESYAEFIVDESGVGRCMVGNPEIRKMCESMDASWDVKNNKCDLGQGYCLKKGGEWKPQIEKCVIPDAQKVFEFILGTTITRLGATAVNAVMIGSREVFDVFFDGCGYDGDFKIREKCMDLGDLSNDSKLKIWDCNNTKSQKLFYNTKDYTIRPMSDFKKCLDIPNADIKNGAELRLWDCNNNNAQKFIYNEGTDQISPMLNEGLCFDLSNDNIVNGTSIKLALCKTGGSQQFNLTRDKLRDTGATCMVEGDRLADCPNEYKNMGASCLRDAHTDSTDSGRVADCPSEYKNMGASCLRDAHTDSTDAGRVADCPSGYKNMGASCLRDAHTDSTDAGRVADCPSGYTNNGANCGRGDTTAFWDSGRVADCPSGYTNDGASCRRDFQTKTSDFGLGSYESADCPKGYYNDGTSCMHLAFGRGSGRDDVFYDGWKKCREADGDGTNSSCEKYGARVYPKCSYLAKQKGYANWDKWSNDACCMCSPVSGYRQFSISEAGQCPPSNDSRGKYTNKSGALCYVNCENEYGSGWYNNGTSCARDVSILGMGSMTCNSGEFKSGARCYKNCSEIYGSDYTHDGTRCYRPVSSLSMSSMTCNSGEFRSGGRCYKNCNPGYTQTGVSCYRGPDSLGMSSMTCNSGEFRSGGRCYKNCNPGYTQTGVSCYRAPDSLGVSSMTCNSGEFRSGGRCYKNCKSGYTQTGVSCYRGPDSLGMSSMTCLPWEKRDGGRCYTANFPDFTDAGIFQTRTKDTKNPFDSLIKKTKLDKLKNGIANISTDFKKSFPDAI